MNTQFAWLSENECIQIMIFLKPFEIYFEIFRKVWNWITSTKFIVYLTDTNIKLSGFFKAEVWNSVYNFERSFFFLKNYYKVIINPSNLNAAVENQQTVINSNRIYLKYSVLLLLWICQLWVKLVLVGIGRFGLSI